VVAVEYLGPVVSPETAETRRQAAARKADMDAALREVADRKKALAEAERQVRQLRTGKLGTKTVVRPRRERWYDIDDGRDADHH
jgi:hypothetical protein